MSRKPVFDGSIFAENGHYEHEGKKYNKLDEALYSVLYSASLVRARKSKPFITLVYLNADGTYDCQWNNPPYKREDIQQKLDNLELKKPNGEIWTGMVLLFKYDYPFDLCSPFFTKLYFPSTVAETVSMIL